MNGPPTCIWELEAARNASPLRCLKVNSLLPGSLHPAYGRSVGGHCCLPGYQQVACSHLTPEGAWKWRWGPRAHNWKGTSGRKGIFAILCFPAGPQQSWKGAGACNPPLGESVEEFKHLESSPSFPDKKKNVWFNKND